MYLLDTNVLSELRKYNNRNNPIHPKVASWYATIHPKDTFISVVTIAEIQLGILALARKDKLQANVLKRWLNDFVMVTYQQRILPIDIEIAKNFAMINVPDRQPIQDGYICATAMSHRFTLVTRNVADFHNLKVKLINPFE